MTHRIRAAMADGQPGPLGGLGKTVEADETYFGNSAQDRRSAFKARGSGVDKWKVVSLVERGGKARSVRVDFLTANRVREVIVTNVDRKSDLMTDESNICKRLGEEFPSYGS